MADRVLTWFLKTPIEVGDEQRETYQLDADYTAGRVWLHVSRAPTQSNIVIDITADGTSLFTSPLPGIQRKSEVGERNYFSDVVLKAEMLVRLNIDQIGAGEGGANLTVQLELEKT